MVDGFVSAQKKMVSSVLLREVVESLDIGLITCKTEKT